MPFTLWELRPIKRLYPKINLKALRDNLNKTGYWEWLGYWAWRGGALSYTEEKPKCL
jgi:hypothetical protein